MKKKLILLLMIGAISQLMMAGDWKTRYIKDAFGDSDYSQPVYTVDLNGTTNVVREGEKCVLGLMVKPSPGYPVFLAFLHRNGHTQSFFTETHVFIKLANGKKCELPCDADSYDLWIGTTPQECNAILDVLNQGNFTLVIKSTSMFGDDMTCTFHIGNQTTGIRNLVKNKCTNSLALGKATSSASGKPTFKGKIGGKYSITVQFDQLESVFENGGTLTGTYWYGSGSNGKMKLKGSVDGLGRIDMEEYDPQGKRCGDWFLNTLSSDDGMKYALDGVMTNAKGQTFNVSLTQQ